MTKQNRIELLQAMERLEHRMRVPERGQTTLETLKNEIAQLADALYWILIDMKGEE